MTQWYYMQDGQSVGPVGIDRLKQLAQAGILARDSVVREEKGDWVEAAEVRGLLTGEMAPVNHNIGPSSSGSSKKYVLLAAVIVFLLVVVGMLAVTVMGGGDPVPAELIVFRDSLIKLRSDLKLGLSDRDYHDALKSQQFAADKAATVTVPEEHRHFYELLSSAFDEYLEAQACIEYLNNPKLLPEYASVAAIEAKKAEVEKQLNIYESLASSARMTSGVPESTANKLRELQMKNFNISREYTAEFSKIETDWNAAIAKMSQQKQRHWEKANALIDQAVTLSQGGT